MSTTLDPRASISGSTLARMAGTTSATSTSDGGSPSKGEQEHCSCCLCRSKRLDSQSALPSPLPRAPTLDTTSTAGKKTKPNITPFRFLNLPAEVRCLVYEELLVVERVYFKGTDNEIRNSGRYHTKNLYRRPFVKLLQVSKLIHQEAEPIYVSKNLFVLPLGWHIKEPFRSIQPGHPYLSGGSAKKPHLFSKKALGYLKNISIAIDVCDVRGMNLDHALWQRKYMHRRWTILPEDDRLKYLHDQILLGIEDPIFGISRDDKSTWHSTTWTLCYLENYTADDMEFNSFNYLEIDYTNAFCPMGCCRPMYLVPYRWTERVNFKAMDIIGLRDEDEETEIMKSLERNDKFTPSMLANVRFRKTGDVDRWAHWAAEQPVQENN